MSIFSRLITNDHLIFLDITVRAQWGNTRSVALHAVGRNNNMNRRKFIVGAGGIGAVTLGGAALLPGGAAAQVGSHHFAAHTITGASDGGTLDAVEVEAYDILFSYNGLDSSADDATVELQVVDANGDAETIDQATRDDISGQSQSNLELGKTLKGDVLEHSNVSDADFEETDDGETRTQTDIDLRLKVTVNYNANSVSGTSDADLTVVMTNIESEADVGGEADGDVVSYEQITRSDDGWITLLANFGAVTQFKIELDSDVYGGWPDNSDEYFQEVIVDHGADGPTDEYRFGFHGPGGVGQTDNTEGYIRANYGTDDTPDRKDFGETEDIDGFTASESEDKHTYTFTIDWDALDIDAPLDAPGAPDELILEAFGGDGGEGRMGSTGDVYYDVE